MKYVYVIERATDGSYSAYVPDLPGCTTSADSLDELRESVKDAVELYIDGLKEAGQPIPEPGVSTGVVEAA